MAVGKSHQYSTLPNAHCDFPCLVHLFRWSYLSNFEDVDIYIGHRRDASDMNQTQTVCLGAGCFKGAGREILVEHAPEKCPLLGAG